MSANIGLKEAARGCAGGTPCVPNGPIYIVVDVNSLPECPRFPWLDPGARGVQVRKQWWRWKETDKKHVSLRKVSATGIVRWRSGKPDVGVRLCGGGREGSLFP